MLTSLIIFHNLNFHNNQFYFHHFGIFIFMLRNFQCKKFYMKSIYKLFASLLQIKKYVSVKTVLQIQQISVSKEDVE